MVIFFLLLYIIKINMTNKYALIVGINGQDGSFLTELLLSKNYKVWGIIRSMSSTNLENLDILRRNKKLKLVYGDITDIVSLYNILMQIKNKKKETEIVEIYNLAAQSHDGISYKLPIYTTNINSIGTLNILETIRNTNMTKEVKFFQATTGEMFGNVREIPQKETTNFCPQSPYAISKLYSYLIVKSYRESYDMFACSGILFNHISHMCSDNFVLRKITKGVANIINHKDDCIHLGNLDAKRDIGYSKDYVEGMWLMLQQERPDDYIFATNKQHTIRELVEYSFEYVGIYIKWKGEGLEEIGYDENTGDILIRVNKKHFRPLEVDTMLGDYSKAKDKLGWEPTICIKNILEYMIDNDNKAILKKI
jgi:GDPmannose 4,6-dehydratase